MVGLWLAVWLASVGGGLAILCDEVHLKCLYRTGCGKALQLYMVHCAGLARQPGVCPEPCQHALIALMSTNEGKALMTCECRDESCRQTKERVEVCRPQVQEATHNTSVVTCVVAQWICEADTSCATALKYYHANCRSMFQGKRCSPRCKNSLDILRRQEKAAKLDACTCDGRENYDCLLIRRNMNRMCFQKKTHPSSPPRELDISNEVVPQDPNHGFKIQLPSSLLLFIPTLVMYR